jgi:hypothetical protein
MRLLGEILRASRRAPGSKGFAGFGLCVGEKKPVRTGRNPTDELGEKEDKNIREGKEMRGNRVAQVCGCERGEGYTIQKTRRGK